MRDAYNEIALIRDDAGRAIGASLRFDGTAAHERGIDPVMLSWTEVRSFP
jgi:hypothetical protein